MAWELQNDRQIWLQLSEIMMRQIISGTYPPGARLPSVRDLAADAGVNPNTMQRAMAHLEESGLICVQRNTGSFVTQDAVCIAAARREMANLEFDTFRKKMEQLGFLSDELAEFLKMKEENV